MAQFVYTMNRVGKIVPPKRQILKDISLSFFPGAKIGVLGLNGAGKSTLLKIMAGVDTEIEGEAIPMPGIKIGYLPQEPVLDPEKTVRETVAEGLGDIFMPTWDGSMSSALANGVPSDCYEAAQAALNGENPVGGALYFNTGSGKGIKIGAHQFY